MYVCLFVKSGKSNAIGTTGQASRENYKFVTNCVIYCRRLMQIVKSKRLFQL